MGAVRKIKNVEWEKHRRDRLNLTYSELSQLLPNHDPSLTLSKAEILRRSVAYITELRERNNQLLESTCSATLKAEMAALRQQVGELRRRNRQLVELLRSADASSAGRLLFTPPRKYRGRITQLPADMKNKEENRSVPIKNPTLEPSSLKKKNKTTKVKQRTGKPTKKVLNTKSVDVCISKVVAITEQLTTKVVTPLKEINTSIVKPPIVNVALPKTVTVPCTTVSLVLANSKPKLATVGAPVMATSAPVLGGGLSIGGLGPGTLIMSDGRVVTVPVTPHIIVNRPPPQPAVILMQNIAAVKRPATQGRPIVPKTKQDTTRTTFVNKVPIPAIRVERESGAVRNRRRDGNKTDHKNKEKKCANGKSSEEGTVKENRIVDNKQTNCSNVKEASGVNKSVKNVGNKLVQKSVDGDKKGEDHMKNNNAVRRKPSDLNNRFGSIKRQKVDENIHKDASKVLPISSGSVAQISNNNELNSNQPITLTDFKATENQPAKIAANTFSSQKEIIVNSEIEQVLSKEPTEKLPVNILSDAASCNEINTGRVVSVNIPTDCNKDSNERLDFLTENLTESRITVNSVPSQSQLIEKENIANNRSSSNIVVDNSVSKSIMDNTDSTSVVNKNTQSDLLIAVKNIAVLETPNTKSSILENINAGAGKTSKPLVSQSSKGTQITADQLKYAEENSESLFRNKIDKTLSATESIKADVANKSSPEKTSIQDVSQDLTSLFPIDPKLQVCPDNILRDADFRDKNLFMPISHSYMEEVRLSLPHSDFSNDLFSSLQVPTGGQHPESISPTAAFLLAFPLVSTSKTSEMIAEGEGGESQHATQTTILQIGNIDPPGDLYQQMIENNVSDLHDPMKLNKSPVSGKNNSKQTKRVEAFQQIQMNDLLRTENVTRNNCKEKKSFPDIHDHNLYLSCNKKKANGRSCDYPLTSDIVSHFQDKPFEFSPVNAGNNSLPSHNRLVGVGNNQKKSQPRTEVMLDTNQNPFPVSTQSYSYNTFPSGSDFSFPSSSCIPINQTSHQNSKPAQTLSNFTSTWSTSSITATSNCVDYSSPYCSYPQKPYTNLSNNKTAPQKQHLNSFEDPRLKEKTPSNNSLPKFSTNFQFNSNNNQLNLNSHVYSNNTNQIDAGIYKVESKAKKQKISADAQRPPVNWMTTPDVRPVIPDSNVAPVLPDLFPLQKEHDFNSSANNMFSTANNITPFSISSSVSNNTQTFYPNSHFSGIDFQLDFAPFPEITSTKTSTKCVNTASNSQYSWSPNKSAISLLPHIDSHLIPSTLPTLVGDLALGTTTPSGPIDTFRNLNMPTTPFSVETSTKKCDPKPELQKTANKLPEKDCFSTSERRNSVKNTTDYCHKTHSHQGTNTTSSFLSVSQLVDPVKSEQSSSRRAGKQVASKSNNGVQKRNISHQTDKLSHSKNSIVSSMNASNNYHLSLSNPVASNQQKPETFHQDHTSSNYPNMFGNNFVAVPWQNNKPSRSSNYKGGSYSAESLIAEHQPPNPVTEITPYNQYNTVQKTFMDAPIVTSASYSSTDFTHQTVDFQTSQHTNQNCFNFPTHNTLYSEDYHNIGLDSMYGMNHLPAKNTDSNKAVQKRSPPKRREEFPPMLGSQQMQCFPRDNSSRGVKCPSPSHHGTSSVTNFNLSTIFPEINDKRAQGTNSYHSINSKLNNDSSANRASHRADFTAANFNTPPQLQTGLPPPPPPVSFTNVGQPSVNFRPQ